MYRPRYNLKTCVTCLCLENCLRKLFTSSTVLTKNHYDSLGITPRATQAQVKSAYYKLSKIHHPDRNDGSEASSQKFREVSAAYEILGNVKLRKMYDKGLIGTTKPTYREHPEAKFYRSRETRTRPPPPDGRTPIYDFDEWSKQHYGATFARDMHLKRKREIREMAHEESINTRKSERVVAAFIVTTLLILYASSKNNDYDTVKEIDSKKNR